MRDRTTDSKTAIARMVAFKNMTGLSEGCRTIDFKPYKPPKHPRLAEMEAYKALPSKGSDK